MEFAIWYVNNALLVILQAFLVYLIFNNVLTTLIANISWLEAMQITASIHILRKMFSIDL